MISQEPTRHANHSSALLEALPYRVATPSCGTARRRPRGGRPYIAQSGATLDLRREEGFSYVMDWPADDQPFCLRALQWALSRVLQQRDLIWLAHRDEVARYVDGLPPSIVPGSQHGPGA